MPVHTLMSKHSDQAARDLRRALEAAGGLTNAMGIAGRWHVSKARAHQLTQQPGFPEPVLKVGRSQLWIVTEVEAWRRARCEK